jgi:hypothetical protein
MSSIATAHDGWQSDDATVISIAIVAYAVANVVHESVGHGGACVLSGCVPQAISSIHFAGDDAGVSDAALRWIAAAGSIANLVLGLFALALLPRAHLPHWRVFLWLLAFVNLLQAAGYLLFSGIGNIGDWAVVVAGWEPAWAWRGGLAVVGAASYVWVARECARAAAPLVGAGSPDRERRARRLAWTAYFAGGILYCAAGVLNPLGPLLLLISAAAASFGGTSGFLWCMSWLRRPSFAVSDEPPAIVTRHRGWMAAGIATAIVFVAVLGPGIHLQ